MGIESGPEQYKKSLLEMLQEKFPQKSSVNNIMEGIRTEEEMKTFFDTYVEYVKNDDAETPEAIVANNIRYIVGQFSDQGVANRWGKFLPKLKNQEKTEEVVS